MALKTYFTPESLSEALTLKSSYGYQLEVIAGGTMMMPQINEGYFFPEMVMGLRRANMNHIDLNGKAVIGATATMAQMMDLPEYPILQDAAHSIAGWAVRNMATVGGNLFNQPPYGDFCVALLALGAEIRIQNINSERIIDLNDFMIGGRQLGPDELITEIHVAKPAGRTGFRKYGRRKLNAATIVTLAAQVEMAQGLITRARIALGGVDLVPKRFPAAEDILVGAPISEEIIDAAAAAAAATSNPVTDPVATEWYRRRMVEVQLKYLLRDLLSV